MKRLGKAGHCRAKCSTEEKSSIEKGREQHSTAEQSDVKQSRVGQCRDKQDSAE